MHWRLDFRNPAEQLYEMGVCMVAASHQFCLGLFVPLPGNPQSVFLEWLMCPGTVSPCCSGTYIAGGNMSSGKHGGLTGETCGCGRGRVSGWKHPSLLVPSDPSCASRPEQQ